MHTFKAMAKRSAYLKGRYVNSAKQRGNLAFCGIAREKCVLGWEKWKFKT